MLSPHQVTTAWNKMLPMWVFMKLTNYKRSWDEMACRCSAKKCIRYRQYTIIRKILYQNTNRYVNFLKVIIELWNREYVYYNNTFPKKTEENDIKGYSWIWWTDSKYEMTEELEREVLLFKSINKLEFKMQDSPDTISYERYWCTWHCWIH